MRGAGLRAGARRRRPAIQGQRRRRYHCLCAGGGNRRPSARGRSLHLLRQGGEIPLRRCSIWRLRFLRLPLGAVWRRRTAAAHLVLSGTIPSHGRSTGARSMARQLLAFWLGSCLLALLPALEARAVEMPVRKAGLWEMKMVRTGSPLPEMTMQHCTDATTDKQMSSAFSPMSKDVCSRQDIQKTATGYVTDSVCSVGGTSVTS